MKVSNAKVSEVKSLNGVDVEAVENTVKAIQENPELANFKFRLNNRWINGGQSRSTVTGFYGANQDNPHLQSFELDADEPTVLAGKDQAANPVEYLLHSLSTCLSTTLVYHAALRGIRIDELESQLEGDIDLRGFLGLSDEVRGGYQNIRVNFKVKTDAENLERLRALSKLSPVVDVISNGTNLDIQIERK